MKKIILNIALLPFLLSCSATASNSISNNVDVYYQYKTIKPYLCLTFDDGPNKYQTPKVLSILDKYNIKATFFVIGENIEYQKEYLKQVSEKGHEIGNHFYYHENINHLSKKEIKDNITKTNELIYKVTGKYPKVVRPPYGIVNSKLKEVCNELNMDIILWSKDSNDWQFTPSHDIVINLTKNVSNGDIFLFHDSNKKFSNTLTAIDEIIPLLIDKGYTWITISSLIKK